MVRALGFIFFLSFSFLLFSNLSFAAPDSASIKVRLSAPVFYCKTFSDALFIATEEEKSLKLNETDEEYLYRIWPLIASETGRCTADILSYKEIRVRCYWNGVTVESPRAYGKKYIVEVRAKSYTSPVYIFSSTEIKQQSSSDKKPPLCSTLRAG